MGRTQKQLGRDALFGAFAFLAGLFLVSTGEPNYLLAGGIAMLGGAGLMSVSM